jgi:hypothetical protein
MRQMSALVILLSAGLISADEPLAHEEAVKQALALLERVTTALTTILDAQTADTARPELHKLAVEWQALQKKVQQLPPPERAEKDRLAKEYRRRFEVAQAKLRGEIVRVEAIVGSRAALQEIASLLKKPEQ